MQTAHYQPLPETLPQHVAIIMDGNGRWAKSKRLPLLAGHKKGANVAKNIVKACAETNIPYLTLYTFSSENWNRSNEEVSDLMQLLRFYLKTELKSLHKDNVKLLVIGDRTYLPPEINNIIDEAENLTQHNTRLTLALAISYGSRQEIINATQRIAQDVKQGNITPDDINATTFENYLYTHPMPEPDLLIRTGGDLRMSNFLLWQAAYTELYFVDTLWPDFSKDLFIKAINEFSSRERRYGSR